MSKRYCQESRHDVFCFFLNDIKGPMGTGIRTAIAAAIGGTASVLGGGKFANGATTAAFQHLFNYEAHRDE